jgi:hypothetical protein
MNLLQNSEQPDFGTWQPAAADDGMSLSQAIFDDPTGELGKLNRAAERSQRLVDNINSHELAVEEAYDRRIKAVREATGVELDNPERHRMTERERRQLRMEGVDATAIPTYQRKLFDDRLAILQNAHSDKAEKLQFGDINEEAMAVAKDAEDEYEQARRSTRLGTAASLMASFGGGFVGSLRDPLMTGTMIAGPTLAAGKSIAARIFSAAWRQGAYNAGITALEQPSVQAWRAKIGAESGFTPAVENVGMSFLFGAIPGAVFRGIGEIPGALKAPLKRVLDGNPQPGDLEKAMEAANAALREIDGDIKPRSPAERAIRMGEEMDAADRAVRVPQPKDMAPELHDDLTQAALRHADDPSKPTPQAIAAVNAIEAYHGSPHDFEAFDLSKIGTGEGVQSYGRGIYVAENVEVARDYQKKFDARSGSEQDATLYKVRIHADREHMLDWDKPLSEQTPYVQDALRQAMGDAKWNEFKSANAGDAIKRGFIAPDQQTVSAKLREAGIPGIRYLDQGSRVDKPIEKATIQYDPVDKKYRIRDQWGAVAGETDTLEDAKGIVSGAGVVKKTSNFVIFDDKLIDITHKNDKPLHPVMEEVQQRITEVQPQSRAEAEHVASEALEDIGMRQEAVRVREELARTLDEGPERIVAATVIADGRVFIGHNHAMAAEEARKAIPGFKAEFEPFNRGGMVEGGFITSKGRIVSRDEAYKIREGEKAVEGGRATAERTPGLKDPENKALAEHWQGKRPVEISREMAPASSKDPLDKVPWTDEDGNTKLISMQNAAHQGDRDLSIIDIIRECK